MIASLLCDGVLILFTMLFAGATFIKRKYWLFDWNRLFRRDSKPRMFANATRRWRIYAKRILFFFFSLKSCSTRLYVLYVRADQFLRTRISDTSRLRFDHFAIYRARENKQYSLCEILRTCTYVYLLRGATFISSQMFPRKQVLFSGTAS